MRFLGQVSSGRKKGGISDTLPDAREGPWDASDPETDMFPKKSRKVLSKRILAWLRACFDSCAASEPGCTPQGGKRAEFRTLSQTREKAPRTRPTPKSTCFPKNAKERVLAPSTLRYGPVLNRARPPTGKFIFFGVDGHQSLPSGQKKSVRDTDG